MNLARISLVSFLLKLVQFGSLESTALKNKRIIRPCFEEDLAKCSSPADSCENVVEDGDFKLIRLQGIRVSRKC